MKLSLFALAAASIFWLGQAFPVIQHDVSGSFHITSALDKRGKNHHHHHHDSDAEDTTTTTTMSDDNTTASSSSSSSSESGLVPGKYFDRIVIIIFENKDYETAMENKYLKSLPSKHNGVLLTNYRGTSHPSQPNYVSIFVLLSLYNFFIIYSHCN